MEDAIVERLFGIEELQAVIALSDKYDARDIIAAARVKRGAQLLDSWAEQSDGILIGQHDLLEWRDFIRENFDVFELSNGDHCVCGLLFGDFYIGIQDLGISNTSHLFGFEQQIPIMGYGPLQEAWEKYLDGGDPLFDDVKVYVTSDLCSWDPPIDDDIE